MKKLIAIDPGKSGGISWNDSDNMPHAVPMPDTEGDVINQLREIGLVGTTAYIEEVGGFCGKGQPGSSMFKFGRGFGFCIGALMMAGCRVVLVKPQVWQKHFNLGTVSLSGGKTAWKNKLKSKSQQLFPSCDVTLKTADALLILYYANSQP